MDKIENLKIAAKMINEKVEFNVGDIVCWKKGLKNRIIPSYNVPVVVSRVLENPVTSTTGDIGETYFNERLDIVLMFEDAEGDMLEYHYDSRRFQNYLRM